MFKNMFIFFYVKIQFLKQKIVLFSYLPVRELPGGENQLEEFVGSLQKVHDV